MQPIPASQQHPRLRRAAGLLLICTALAALHSGCASFATFPPAQPSGYAAQRAPRDQAWDGIRVTTKDGATLRFADERWALTLDGISGTASMERSDGSAVDMDTTLSYWDVSSAASSGRSSTTKQFLLTILGVILVIGLAALVLYAAFPVNDR